MITRLILISKKQFAWVCLTSSGQNPHIDCGSVLVAAALCKSYVKAQDMQIRAHTYYENLRDAILPSTAAAWDAEIEAAELLRLADPSAMDILKAKSFPTQGAIDVHSTTLSPLPKDSLPISRWFYLAMQIEENQCAVNFFIPHVVLILYKIGNCT